MERNILPCLLVCLINLYFCSAVDPVVDFSCDSNNGVVLPTNTLVKLWVMDDDGKYCKPITKRFSNCKVGDHSDIRVLATEEKSSNIAGGKNLTRYEVMCKDKTKEVKVIVDNIQVTRLTTPIYATTSLTTPIYATTSLTPSISVNMDVKQNGMSLGKTAVAIGEKLQLEITAPTNHTIRPENCTANDGQLTHQQTHILWQPCGGHDEAIIGKDWKLATHILTNDVYAFRFPRSSIVNIECYVTVCPGLNSKECQDLTCAKNERRRRDADDFTSHDGLSSKKAVASVSFNVKSDQTFNKSPGLLADMLLFTMTVFFAMLSIR